MTLTLHKRQIHYSGFMQWWAQGRIKGGGGNGGNCPGPPAARGSPWWNLRYSFQI